MGESSEATGSIWRVAKTGGPFTCVASRQASPAGVAVDREHVYWAFRGVRRGLGGIARIRKDVRACN